MQPNKKKVYSVILCLLTIIIVVSSIIVVMKEIKKDFEQADMFCSNIPDGGYYAPEMKHFNSGYIECVNHSFSKNIKNVISSSLSSFH